MSKPFFVELPDRGEVRIAGPDRRTFLQALATNDIRLLGAQPVVYSCFLTPQGKFLHDFFVREEEDALVLDCEGGARAEHLLKSLKPFRLRSKIELSAAPAVTRYAVFGAPSPEGASPDPRHPDLGWRTATRPADIAEAPFAEADRLRLRLGVADGSRDMAIEKDTVLECNLDRFHGVSFEKGCYIGQEITARMKLRGLVKKHLRPVRILDGAMTPFSDITAGGQLAGQLRSRCGDLGLAMLKDECLPRLDEADSPVRLLD